MNIIRKLIVLPFALFCYVTASSQNSQEETALRDVFKEIEALHGYTFSFEDKAIDTHFVAGSWPAKFNEVIDFLSEETLFNYAILNSNTLAVSLKENVVATCVEVSEGNKENKLENALLQSPFQKVYTQSDGSAFILGISPEVPIQVISPNTKTKASILVSNAAASCIELILERPIEQLAPILITNYVTKGIEKQPDGNVAINYKEFDILPGLIEPDVLLTLQALPGVSSINETVSFLNIRGGTNDQNLILWDGIKMYQSGHFFGQISAFNPFLTKEVTLIKNGSSAQYGDGVSGIIDMQSNAIKTDTIHGAIGFNLLSGDGYVEVPVGDNASIEISGRGSINGLVETPTYNKYFQKVFQNTEVITNSDTQSTSNADFSFYDTSVKMLYTPSEKDYLRANFIIIGNNLDFLENAEVDNISFSRQSELNQNNLSGGLFYRRNWTSALTTEIQFYGSNYSLDAINYDILNDQRLLQTNEVFETGLRASSSIQLSKKMTANIGYQFNETGITNFEQINNPLFEITDKQVLRTNSIFSEATYKTKNTFIRAGVRVNHFSKFKEVFLEPRISFNQRFLKYFTFEILGELKSQTTSQVIDFQNDFLGVENRKWVLANPNTIPILQGQQLSTGVSFNRRNLLITVEPYIKRIKGITSQSQGFQNQFQEAKTTGSYTVKGIDFLVSKQYRKINTWLSYSWAKNTYSFSELNPVVFHNNLDVRHTITYGINYSWNNFNVSGGLNWHSGKPTTSLVAGNEIQDGNLNFNFPNSENIKDYIRIDLSLLYDFKIFSRYHALFGFSLWNALDTNNTINNFYRVNHSNTLEEVNENALQLTPNMTLRIKF